MRARLNRLLMPLIALATCAVLLLVSDRPHTSLPQLPPPHPERPGAVVTMGDSMLSGEGSGHYFPGTDGQKGDWCHRSPHAPISEINQPGVSARINLACSSAQSDQVGLHPGPGRFEGSQAARLPGIAEPYRIAAIVVQLGANDDPRFSDAIGRCAGAWAGNAPRGCAAELNADWQRRVQAMQPKIVHALRDVQNTMRGIGYPQGSYDLIVQSYPSPVAPGIAPHLQNLSGCPFRTPDLQWVRDTAVPQLSEGIRAAADEVGARFLDFSRAGHGHEACTHPQQPEKEWFTRLTIDWRSLNDDRRSPHALQASFHPTPAGNDQFGRCLNTFLTSHDRSAACLPGPRGNLALAPSTTPARASHPS